MLETLTVNSKKMEYLDKQIHNQENHLNELENLKRSLTLRKSERTIEEKCEINTTLEQIDQEIETIYREISVLRIRRLMNV